MRRALRGAVGILLAVAAVVPAPSTPGQARAPRVPSQPPTEILSEKVFVLTAAHYRLEEMKVELALLADINTFPYHFTPHAAGEILELSGIVPNERVGRIALDLACRSTFLHVWNKMIIASNLIVTLPRHPASVLQREAADLLQKNLGRAAEAISIGVQLDGLIVATGSIDSVERRLAVSRLFRELAGCHGVVNELRVTPIPRNCPQMLAASVSDFRPANRPLPAPIPAALPEKPPVVQVALNPSLLTPSSPLDATLQTTAESAPRTMPILPAAPIVPPAPRAEKPANTLSKALVTLPVKILVDQAEPTVRDIWEPRLRERVHEASDILEQHCRVRLEVIEVGQWESDPKKTKLSELFQDFQTKVAAGKARLVIGFTGLRSAADENSTLGCTQVPLQTHMLIREWRPRTEPERLEVLVHALGHFLGACHSPENDSVMRPKLGDGRVIFRSFRIAFDPVNIQVMRLVAEELARRPVRDLEDLSPPSRQRLLDLLSTLTRTMPDNPALVDAIRQLKVLQPELSSAPQGSPQ